MGDKPGSLPVVIAPCAMTDMQDLTAPRFPKAGLQGKLVRVRVGSILDDRWIIQWVS